VFVSAASAWEIATKQRLGKLQGVPQMAERYAELVAADRFLHLDVSHLHALRAGNYEVQHRDPFDRLLAPRGELEVLTLVTRDTAFEMFPVPTLW
jgi:PIN domain nuclease of toxin-antitoxin system